MIFVIRFSVRKVSKTHKIVIVINISATIVTLSLKKPSTRYFIKYKIHIKFSVLKMHSKDNKQIKN